MMVVQLWSPSRVCVRFSLSIGVLREGDIESRASHSCRLWAELQAAAPNLHAVQPDSLKGSFSIELIVTGLASAGLRAAGWIFHVKLA